MKEDKITHPNFEEYQRKIINSPIYEGLAINKDKDGTFTWVAGAKTDIGKQRIEWCLQKAKELKIENKPGCYAKVMFALHPTKEKPCQICGKVLSLKYIYLSKNAIGKINKQFHRSLSGVVSIFNAWDDLNKAGLSDKEISLFFLECVDGPEKLSAASRNVVVSYLEYDCRNNGKRLLGPGAMSNFPDRFDGFHSYNRCCRETEDKGRVSDNMRTYGKDRRAYEYLSDGNIHAADEFMNSAFFKGESADHIGPISLGFVHDPRFIQRMPTQSNSAKRDRLLFADIEKIISIEKKVKMCAMSRQSALIWKFIKENYVQNPEKVGNVYRNALKQSMINYMYILNVIVSKCGDLGINFIDKTIVERQYLSHMYSYSFDEEGNIIGSQKRHFTGRNNDERERILRITLESICDFQQKENRKMSVDMTQKEFQACDVLCKMINEGANPLCCDNHLLTLLGMIQKRIIDSIK